MVVGKELRICHTSSWNMIEVLMETMMNIEYTITKFVTGRLASQARQGSPQGASQAWKDSPTGASQARQRDAASQGSHC